MNEKKVPEIRFKGFTDDWEQRKLGECFTLLQNNTLSRAELSDENGVAMNVHYGDVLIKFDECLDVSKEVLPFMEKQSIADKFKTSYLRNGDVIVADTAEDETVGKCTEIMGLTDQKVISGLHTIPLRPNKEFATGYLGFYLNSAAYHDQLKPLMQGIKVTSISKSAMQDTVIRYPSDIKEQGMIGQYFISLDNLITLHQRKHKKLLSVKKSLLEKMFPQNDAKVPEIRFEGFTDDWDQRKLGDVFQEYSEKNHEELPALTIIQGHGTVRRDESDRNLSYDKSSLGNYKLVSKGDFIVHLRSFEGGLEVANSQGIVSPAYHLLHGENTDSRFYYPYFRSYDFINVQLKPCVYGIRDGRSIDINEMMKIDIPWTSYDEQKRIGDLFERIDNLITLHQRELDKLVNIKKSMLEKMFV